MMSLASEGFPEGCEPVIGYKLSGVMGYTFIWVNR